MKSRISAYFISITLLAALSIAQAQDQQGTTRNGDHKFRVTSSTFSNGGTLPLSMVWNLCPFYPGGLNQSPQLSWSNVPGGTRSFVVIMYDVTASFTHWGMYNMAAKLDGLPENAGVAGSTFGPQVLNDYGVGDLSYDGPCPPPSLSPTNHMYVFTVYALDTRLPILPSFGDFLPGSESLYHALIAVGKHGHILATASISGFFPGSD